MTTIAIKDVKKKDSKKKLKINKLNEAIKESERLRVEYLSQNIKL